MTEQALWAPRAWIDGRWVEAVLLAVDARGHWAGITPGTPKPEFGATVLAGPVLPGLVNAHSHAFQRAFVGLAERRDTDTDDFWSWRDRMYGVALALTPPQLQAVAQQLYLELLCGGYTHTCEFHYLQHREDGQPYDDPATLSWALADAAQQAGMGLTVLPVLYQRAGFNQATLRGDQRRFASSPDSVHALCQAINASGRPLLGAGVAIHSLRAATADGIAALLRHVGDQHLPIHIHVAEQTQEVTDCLQATGARPIEWLARERLLDDRWQLVHATHATPNEIESVAHRDAGVVLCPSTEANLGDGLSDLPAWLDAQVPLAIGSDSQVARCWAHELRWLEYGQRLGLRQRNVAAAPALGQGATAARLFDAVLAGSGRAAGLRQWGLVPGARADALVLDTEAPGVLGLPGAQHLDALVFGTDAPALREVYVAGQRVVVNGRHVNQDAISSQFRQAMAELWGA